MLPDEELDGQRRVLAMAGRQMVARRSYRRARHAIERALDQS
ncbi:hypothetical protein [Streptomyces cucumeris]